MKRMISLSATTLIILLIMAFYCFAICVSRTPEEIIQESQYVIHGNVKEVESSRSDENSRFYTYVKVEVIEVFKGELGDQNEVVVRLRGSKDMLAENQPKLDEGMDVIIHTVLLENGYFVIRGCEDGAYYVQDGIASGKNGQVNMTLEQFRNFVNGIDEQYEEE